MKQTKQKSRALIWIVQLLVVLMVVGMIPFFSVAEVSAANGWIEINKTNLPGEWEKTGDQKFKLTEDITLTTGLPKSNNGIKTLDGNGYVITYTGNGTLFDMKAGELNLENIAIGACLCSTHLIDLNSANVTFTNSFIIMSCNAGRSSAVVKTNSGNVDIIGSTMQADDIVKDTNSGIVTLSNSTIWANRLVGESGRGKIIVKDDSKIHVDILVEKTNSAETEVTGSSICAGHLVSKTNSGDVTVSGSKFSFPRTHSDGNDNLLRNTNSGSITVDETSEFGIENCCGLSGGYSCSDPPRPPMPSTDGSLKIDKHYIGTAASTRFTFTITDKDDGSKTYQEEVTVDSNGNGSVTIDLPPGTYKVEEIGATGGVRYSTDGGQTFEAGSSIEPVVITKGETTSVIFKNYEKPLGEPVTACKEWEGGPTPRPPVWFQLYRQVGEGQAEKVDQPKKVSGGSVSWGNQPNYDENDGLYKYFVKEEYVPKYYTATESEDGMTITNTYSSPMICVKASKKWINGPKVKPNTYFHLWRKTKTGDAERVTGKPVRLTYPNKTLSWNVPQKDFNGNSYKYWVEEVKVPDNYSVSYSKKWDGTLLVTNTYVIPDIEIKVEKEWVNGPDDHPPVDVQLFLGDKPVRKTRVTLTDEKQGHTWTVPGTDRKGNPLKYRVVELTELDNYSSSVKYSKWKRTWIVTNTYQIPDVEIEARKVWVNGPDKHPPVKLQLYLDGAPVDGTLVELTDTDECSWTVEKTDINGNLLDYEVVEVLKASGYLSDVSYSDEEGAWIVTNTYQVPEVKVTANKVWDGGPDQHPDIVLQLYLGKTPIQDPVTLKSGTTTHTWDVPGTDEKGQALVYTVEEVKVPADYEVSYSEDTLTITNKYTKSLVAGDEDETKETVKGDEDTKAPATGQGVSFYLYIGILLVLLSALAVVFGKRAFKKQD